jgi:hypothetical protein
MKILKKINKQETKYEINLSPKKNKQQIGEMPSLPSNDTKNTYHS